MLIDTHAHLDFKDFKNDLEDVLIRAKNANVGKIITIGCNFETSFSAINLADKYKNIYATVGVHPYDSKDINECTFEVDLLKLAKRTQKVVAIGEIGLDYHYEDIDNEKQKRVFEKQLSIASSLSLPVIIHCRDAENDILKVLDKYPNLKIVIHCFPGGDLFTKECLKRGYYLSFTGIVTFKNAQKVHIAAEKCPLDKLMIETDCPFLAPQSHRGSRNEPAFISEIAEKISDLKKVSIDKIVKTTTKNAEEFFKLVNWY